VLPVTRLSAPGSDSEDKVAHAFCKLLAHINAHLDVEEGAKFRNSNDHGASTL
jgi:hypothetical protein